MSWWRRLLAGPVGGWDGRSGRPRSGNGASSCHLVWDAPAGTWTGAEVTLEVLAVPAVPELVFWALQVDLVDAGRRGGGAHLGLQWYPAHPGSTAVNWGGYGPDGRELDGAASALPSATGNPNTRDLAWRAGRSYRLAVHLDPAAPAPAGLAPWRGSVTDLTTGDEVVVRRLWAAGSAVERPMVWSEIFAPCQTAAGEVRWSAPTLVSADGRRAVVESVRVNYQAVADGGCVTTDTALDEVGIRQRTGVDERRTRQGAVLAVPGQSRS